MVKQETKLLDTRKKTTSFWDKSMSIANVVVIIGTTLLMGVGIGASSTPLKNYVNDRLVAKQTNELSKRDFSLYWEVYGKLMQYYVDPKKVDNEKAYYGSIKGMVESVGDAPTIFYTKEETAEYEKAKTGSYSGIGAELDFVNKSVVVIAPFDGSPAAIAGLKPKDVISKVDGKSVANKTLTAVVMEIRGEAGTKVTLTVLRPNENYKEYKIEITRGNVTAPSMNLVEVKDGIALVKISRFSDSSLGKWISDWDLIVNQLKSKADSGEIKGVIIDLRNNPGGYFDAAIVMAGDFLPSGTIVSYQREKGDIDKSFPTITTPRLQNIPLEVLVNGSSASASEIFAGAMKHYERAKLIGENTYGKGTAQIIVPVSDGSSLHVTVSKWLLPDKTWINPENTIKPDIEVPFDYESDAKGEDNQLTKAYELFKK